MSVVYEEISDSVVIQGRQKYSSADALCHKPPETEIPETPTAQATPILPSATPFSPKFQQQSQHPEDTSIYAIPEPMGDLMPKQCVPHNDNIKLVQNSAYQKAKAVYVAA